MMDQRSVVSGDNIIMYVEKVNGSGVFAFTTCGIGLSMEETAEEVNKTTADSGRQNVYASNTALDCSVSMDGLITLDNLSQFMYEDWKAAVGTVKRVRIDFTNGWGDRLRYEFDLWIGRVSAQGDANDLGAFSISGKRSGPEVVSKGYDHILVDIDLDPILDTDGDLIRTP